MPSTNYASLLKQNKRIIHCITNYITANDCANFLLAAGASPTMAHHPAEMEEIQTGCHALVCNLGATESFDAMLVAAKAAKESNHPLVIDPVGCGGSSLRRDFFWKLVDVCTPACIRGNSSEIKALTSQANTVTGVDAISDTTVTSHADSEVIIAAKSLALECNCIVVASGKIDVITNGNEVVELSVGDAMMGLITGTGCMSSCLLGAYLAIDNSMNAVVSCCERIGIAGEKAAKKTRESEEGTMAFRNYFIDCIYLG